MKIFKTALCVFAIGFFSLCGILSVAFSDKDFSEDENRSLAELPELTAESFLNGEYQAQLDTYLCDQTAFREVFMRVYGSSQKLMAKCEYNNIYLCDDNWIIDKYNTPENTETIAQKFSKLAESVKADCTLMLVPTAVSIYDEVLPWGLSFDVTQKDTADYIFSNSKMKNVELWESFENAKNDTQLFYKNDHHWTTDGAYIAYTEYCKAMGFEALPKSSFDIECVSDSFYGTTYSKALTAFQPADEMYAYKQDMNGITVTYQGGEGELYWEEYLDKKDKYSYFLGSNQPLVVIDNANVTNGRTLVVAKDSYANCLVPFLINHFEKVVVLDTRYYRNGVSYATEFYNATDVLLCFNLNTLDTDTAIAGIY